MFGRLTILPVLFATSLSGQGLPRQRDEWVPYTKGAQPSIKQYIPASPDPVVSNHQPASSYYQSSPNNYYESGEDTGKLYYGPPTSVVAENTNSVYNKPQIPVAGTAVDQISDKNYKPPPVATASTGGLPFIVYALKNIFWLFIVGIIFIMFVGTITAFAYRWTHAYHGGSFGRITDLDTTALVYKALQIWQEIEESDGNSPIKKIR